MLPHHVGGVENSLDLLGCLGDVIEGDPAVLVHGDAKDAPLARGSDLDRFDVEAEGRQGVDEFRFDAIPGCVRLGAAHGCDLLVLLWAQPYWQSRGIKTSG